MNFQLKALRKRNGYTQEDIARAIGETKRVVGAWERQDTLIPFEKAYDIAVLLNCSLDELAGRADYIAQFTDERQAELNAVYNGLDDANKGAALGAVQGIATNQAREKTEEDRLRADSRRTA